MANDIFSLLTQGGNAGKQADVSDAISRIAGNLQPKVTTRKVPMNPVTPSLSPGLENYDSYQDYLDDGGYATAANQQFFYDQMISRSEANAQQGIQPNSSDGWFLNQNNLNSSDPLIAGVANLANLGLRFGARVAEIPLNIAAQEVESKTNQQLNAVPEDVRKIYERQQAAAEAPKYLAGYQALARAFQTGEIEKAVKAGNYASVEEARQKMEQYRRLASIQPPTEQELARLNQTDAYHTIRTGDGNYLQTIENARNRRSVARKIGGDPKTGQGNLLNTREWYSDTRDREFQLSLGDMAQAKTLREEAGQAWDKGEYLEAISKGAQSFGSATGDAFSALGENPAYMGDLIVDTLPFLLGKTNAQAMVGDAARLQRQSESEIRNREGVETATGGQQLGALAGTAAYTGLNYISNMNLLKALRGEGSLANRGVTSSADNIAADIFDTSAMQIANGTFDAGAKVASTAVNPLTRLAKSFAVEGGTEALQTQIENNWGNLNAGIDTVGMGESFALGGAMGGLFGVPGIAADTARNAVAKIAGNQQERIDQAFGAPTMSTDDLANPNSPDYAPDKAMNRILAVLPNDATAENLDEFKTRIDPIMQQAEEKLTSLETRIQDVKDLASYEERLAALPAKLEAAREANKDNPDVLAQIDELEKNATETLTAKIQAAKEDEAGLSDLIEERDTFQSRVEKIKEQHSTFTKFYEEKTGNKPQPEGEEDLNDILGAPGVESLQRMQSMLEDVNTPEPIRNTLRVVADAILAQNRVKDLGKVSEDVFKGGKGYRGLSGYISEYAKALKVGNETRRTLLERQISNFEVDHSNKFQAVKNAQAEANRLGTSIQVTRNVDGSWNVNSSERVPEAAFKKNQGVMVHPVKADGTGGATRLIQAIAAENEAIKATAAAMQQMVQTTPSTQPETQAPVITDFDKALDGFIANERVNGRDTAARDRTTKAQTITPVEPIAAVEPSTAEPVTLDNVPPKQPAPSTAPKADVVTEQSASEATVTNITPEEVVPTAEEILNDKEYEPSLDTQEDQDIVLPDDTDVVDTSSEKVTKPKGAISVLQDVDVEAERKKPFEKQNLIVTGFTQVEREGLNSPLATVPDFPRYMKEKHIDSITQRLAGIEATEKQHQAVKAYFEFYDQIKDQIADIVKIKADKQGNPYSDYFYQSMAEFLLDENGKLDSNTSAAIALAAFNWVAENGDKFIDSPREVEAKLHVKDIDNIPPEILERMSQVGTHQQTMIAGLGQRVMQSMQFKRYKGISTQRQARLEMALGSIALATLLQNNLVERTVISAQDMRTMQELTLIGQKDKSATATEVQGNSYFIRPMRGAVEDIRNAAKGSQNILGKVFSFTPYTVLPKAEPTDTVPDTFNEFGSKVPDMAKKVMQKNQNMPYRFNAPLLKFMENIQDNYADELKQMFGYVPEKDLEQRHLYFRESQIAVNDAIERSLNISSELANSLENEDGTFNDFYVTHNMWSNNRSGIEEAFNMQGDKIHRSLASLAADEITVPLNEGLYDKTGKLTKYGQYIRALGFRMEGAKIKFSNGTKAGTTIDKATIDNFLPDFEKYLASPKVMDAVEAMAHLLDNPATEQDKDKIQKIIQLNNELDMQGMSLSAIESLAQMYKAIQNGDKEFKTAITAESDGVTNGAIITNIMLDTASAELRKSGGLFPKAPFQIKSVPQYREVGNNGKPGRDMYEQLGSAQMQAWETIIQDAVQKTKSEPEYAAAVFALDSIDRGNYGARKGAKRAATPFNYGSGFDSINRASGRGTIEAFYKNLEKAIKSGDRKQLDKVVADVNAVLAYSEVQTSPFKLNPDNALDSILTPSQTLAFMQVDMKIHGESTEQALTQISDRFIAQRDVKTAIAVSGFAMYEMLMNKTLAAAEQKAVRWDEVPTVKGTIAEGLNNEQLQAVQRKINKYMPALMTPMGIASKSAWKSAIPLMKSDRVWSTDKNTELQIQFKKTIDPNGYSNLSSESLEQNRKASSLRSNIQKTVISDPGVSGLALYIQSHDAFISFYAMQKHDLQNYHDANAGNPYLLNAFARSQNQGFLEALIISHAGRAFTEAYFKPLRGVTSGEFDLSSADKKQILSSVQSVIRKYDAVKKVDGKTHANYEAGLVALVREQFASDLSKLHHLAQDEYINQYGTEGGEYQITDADRKRMIKQVDMLKARRDAMIKEARELASKLNAMDQGNQPMAPTSLQEILASDPESLQDPKVLISTLQKELRQYKGQGGKSAKFAQIYSGLLDIVAKGSMADNLQINIFDQADIPAHVKGADKAKDLRAWYVTGKNPQINLKLDSSVPLNATTIVHELIHAVTAEIFRNPEKSPEVQEIVGRMERLLEHVKSKVTDNSPAIVKYGTSNLDEFLATGLTDPTFVDFLDKIYDAPKEARSINGIVSALREFAKNILDAIYAMAGVRKYNPEQVTAYEALVIDTTDLIGKAEGMQSGNSEEILGAPRERAIKHVSEYTAKEVFDALDDGKLDGEFKDHLGNLVETITDTLFAELDQKFLTSDQEYSPEQLWDMALQKGKAPYSTQAIQAGYTLTAQERFAVEALEIALTEALKNKSLTPVFREMQRSYDKAYKELSVQDFFEGDWSNASAEQRKVAQQKYDHLFKVGQGDYLARFVSMAIASQEVKSKLGFNTLELPSTQQTDPFQKLMQGVDKVVNSVYSQLTRTSDSLATNTKLSLLATQLIELDLRNRNQVVTNLEKSFSSAEDSLNSFGTGVRKAAAKVIDSLPIHDTDNRYLNIVSNTLKSSANGRLFSVFDVIKEWRDQEMPNQRLGFLGELNNEIMDGNLTTRLAQQLLGQTKQIEHMRQRIEQVTKQDMLSHFEKNGEDLTYEDRTAITYAALRTDLQSLTGKYSLRKIHSLVKDDLARKQEITKLESQIPDQVMINRAKDLGWYMVSGVGNNLLAKNAELIAMNAGLANQGEAKKSTVDLIDRLATLYALEYSSPAHLNTLNKIMTRELKREGTNGIDATLKFHKALVEDSKQYLFADNKLSVVKGYMPEITNSHREVLIARSKTEADMLKASFYKEIGPVRKDPIDPDTNTNIMFYSEDSGHQRIISGALAVNSYGRKGTEIQTTPQELADVSNRMRSRVATHKNYDPRQVKHVQFIPSYDVNGKVQGVNYEMSAHVRDTYLERNNDFSDLVGTFASLGFDKVNTPENNRQVIDALHEDFVENYKQSPMKYIKISPESRDPSVVRAWAMLPQDTRNYVREVWGESGLYVSNEIFLSIFGAPKYTISDAYDKVPEYRNVAEKVVVELMQQFFGDNARVRTAQGERIWQEAVQVMKNFVVIRNVTTLAMNLVANTFLLMSHGVNPTQLIKDSMASIKGGTQYRKDMANLVKLRMQQRAGIPYQGDIEREIAKLENSLERNPLREFIDAGMFAGIVEDIDPNQDRYSYKSGLQRKYEDKLESIPKSVRTATQWLLVSPGTPHYQFLHNATQFSDFSAKYVLYKHYTERASKRLTKAEAMQMASDNFINYDVPTSPGMQYMNDMGLVMFTKYNLRIQKALFRLLSERPASAIGQALIINHLTNLPAGIDPIVFNQMGNPFRDGPFGILDTWDEPFPIQAIKSVF